MSNCIAVDNLRNGFRLSPGSHIDYYNQDVLGMPSHRMADSSQHKRTPSILVIRGDPWTNKVDLNQAERVLLNFNSNQFNSQAPYQQIKIEWPLFNDFDELTECDSVPVFNQLDESTLQFINERNLTEDVIWLKEVTAKYFDNADFEIVFLPGDDEDGNLLGLKVYSMLNSMEFRKRRHKLSAAMLAMGKNDLYKLISIFQRRLNTNARQAFSWYGSISTE